MKLSVVIPVYNEEGNLRPLHARISAVAAAHADDHEMIFVDDGSTDDSLAVIRELKQDDPHVRFVSFSRNFGHEIATTAGLDHAGGDAVVLIDADLQDPPEVIPQMLERWQAGAHVVYAQRRRRPGESGFKRLSAFLFYRTINLLSNVDIPVDTGDFRLMDRRVVEAVCKCRENPRFIRGLVSWVGFRQEALRYDRDERHAGETKYGLAKLLRLSAEAICGFSLFPLRAVLWLGGAITLISLLVSLVLVVRALFAPALADAQAFTACAMFFLGGVGLVALGVVGLYVGHIYGQSQHRPLYVVDTSGGWEDARPACSSDPALLNFDIARGWSVPPDSSEPTAVSTHPPAD